jgi:alkylhydroperoxidase/carboxymuconolactone decarboxylase family protein YurZ
MTKPLEPRLDALEQPYKDMIGKTPAKVLKRLQLGLKIDPGLLSTLETWRLAALSPEALDAKTVQLVSFGILLAQTSEAAGNHARAAVRAGATLAELHATAAIAALFRGLAAFNLAGEVLSALKAEQDGASPE